MYCYIDVYNNVCVCVCTFLFIIYLLPVKLFVVCPDATSSNTFQKFVTFTFVFVAEIKVQ